MHNEPSPLAGKTVQIKKSANTLGGLEYRVEDFWDRVSDGKSWMDCKGNPACLSYAMRMHDGPNTPPLDNEVLYGKIGPLGHLVHVSEIEA